VPAPRFPRSDFMNVGGELQAPSPFSAARLDCLAGLFPRRSSASIKPRQAPVIVEVSNHTQSPTLRSEFCVVQPLARLPGDMALLRHRVAELDGRFPGSSVRTQNHPCGRLAQPGNRSAGRSGRETPGFGLPAGAAHFTSRQSQRNASGNREAMPLLPWKH
jgi:hypothetical protein